MCIITSCNHVYIYNTCVCMYVYIYIYTHIHIIHISCVIDVVFILCLLLLLLLALRAATRLVPRSHRPDSPSVVYNQLLNSISVLYYSTQTYIIMC